MKSYTSKDLRSLTYTNTYKVMSLHYFRGGWPFSLPIIMALFVLGIYCRFVFLAAGLTTLVVIHAGSVAVLTRSAEITNQQ